MATAFSGGGPAVTGGRGPGVVRRENTGGSAR